jgi:hypothetical protein
MYVIFLLTSKHLHKISLNTHPLNENALLYRRVLLPNLALGAVAVAHRNKVLARPSHGGSVAKRGDPVGSVFCLAYTL